MTFRSQMPACRTGRCHGWLYAPMKRLMDITAAGVGLILTAPLLLACGLWIYLMDGRPVLFRQWRVGAGGWLFQIYKLRTMKNDAELHSGAQFATSGDPRVLPGCRWMRKSHVDELPQLVNILLGQMSLVGPRPERPEMMRRLRQSVPRIERRLAGPPGLTGLAQIHNGYTNDPAGARRRQALDLRYLRRRSLIRELRLILATIPKVWDHAAM